MKIIIVGKQKFSFSVLQKFNEETEHDVVAFLSDSSIADKIDDQIKSYSANNKIPFFKNINFNDEKLINKIKNMRPDICILAYVNSFIPKLFRDIPVKGTICYHPSLLPEHRGPSAINWPIIFGSKKTGLTIFYPNDQLDRGDIILQKKISIKPNETLGDVYFSKLYPLGVEACVEAVDLIVSGNVKRITQDESKASYETWCKKSNAKIYWENSGQDIYNLIRGCNPHPGAWANLNSKEFFFYDTVYKTNKLINNCPGQILSIKKNEIIVAVKKGTLNISKIKSEQGKLFVKDMDTTIFKNGDIFS